MHGGVFVLLLAPISHHSLVEHRVERVCAQFLSPLPRRDSALGKWALIVPRGGPSLLGTREREDLHRSRLTPFRAYRSLN